MLQSAMRLTTTAVWKRFLRMFAKRNAQVIFGLPASRAAQGAAVTLYVLSMDRQEPWKTP